MDEPKARSYLDQMTVGIVNYLEKKIGICQVKNEVKAPADRPAVLLWEQKHSLLLPEDLKHFFLTSNGFDLTWSVKMENQTISVGRMHINNVSQLARLENGTNEGTHIQPSLWDLDIEEDHSDRKLPSFVNSRLFELDPCDGYGKVCLVYKDAPQDYVTEIWFLDRSMRWHFLCDSFLAYYRLMLTHLGLPHWHYAFTDIGLPPFSKQWFNMYAPIRLEMDTEGRVIDVTANGDMVGKVAGSPLDLSKVFKGKNDRKKVIGMQNNTNTTSTAGGLGKRKMLVSSARSATFLGKQPGSSTSQVAVKSSR